mmetsp:Transcript_25381/g.84841  ORF Transcript_25381/g.84841 Transcript_25381/m.84841 type:complete len:209 (-) Transcript_25381:336-962(-)
MRQGDCVLRCKRGFGCHAFWCRPLLANPAHTPFAEGRPVDCIWFLHHRSGSAELDSQRVDGASGPHRIVRRSLLPLRLRVRRFLLLPIRGLVLDLRMQNLELLALHCFDTLDIVLHDGYLLRILLVVRHVVRRLLWHGHDLSSSAAECTGTATAETWTSRRLFRLLIRQSGREAASAAANRRRDDHRRACTSTHSGRSAFSQACLDAG